MILSALLTSVGINLGLCLLFVTLYSVLRKQPSFVVVYAPRLLHEENYERKSHDFVLERFLPSPGWVKQAWNVSEDELLRKLGFDAFVLMRIFIFSLRVFAFAGVVGIFILLPINYLGNQVEIDFSHLSSKSLTSFSISNVNNGSKMLWVHFSAVYVLTGVVCYLLYYEYSYISSKRISFFYSSKPEPNQFTILVRGVPVSAGSSVSETVQTFFKENHSSTYLSHVVVRRTGRLQGLINDTENLYKKVARLNSETRNNQKFKRDGFLGLFGRKVNLVENYEKKLEDLEDKVRLERSLTAGKEIRAAFVSFKSRLGAAIAVHIPQGVNPTNWETELAPEPQEVHWQFFSASFMKAWIYKLVAGIAVIFLTILFLIPVFIVQGLANLEALETWFPFLKGVLSITLVSQVITGYLPSLILQLFLSLVPPAMVVLSSMQGYPSLSQIEKSACSKVLWFTIWNIFFANVLSGTIFTQLNTFLEPKNLPRVLAIAVPAQASFFISYVVTSGWTSLSSELCRLSPLVRSFLERLFAGKHDDEFEVPSNPYHSEIPRILFFGLLGITYFIFDPLILPFIIVYYCFGYIIYRNQLLNVYTHKYETGGKFWPIVHNSTIFSLILMHILAIGIFGIKKLPAASSLILPLPILTLLFNEYCRKRFLPIFKTCPTECLVKRDKEDQNDRTMSEFYDKLVTAYEDPALPALRYSRRSNEHTSPLL